MLMLPSADTKQMKLAYRRTSKKTVIPIWGLFLVPQNCTMRCHLATILVGGPVVEAGHIFAYWVVSVN